MIIEPKFGHVFPKLSYTSLNNMFLGWYVYFDPKAILDNHLFSKNNKRLGFFIQVFVQFCPYGVNSEDNQEHGAMCHELGNLKGWSRYTNFAFADFNRTFLYFSVANFNY